MFQKSLLTLAFFGLVLGLNAQSLLNPSYSFSGSKIAHLTLTDGAELKGTIKNIKRKKGLIKEIKVDGTDGVRHQLKPEQVQFMYLPPSGFDKYTRAADVALDAQKWSNDKLDQGLLGEHYVYFEQAQVMVKKKQQMMMMQLLNPSFSSKVQVYHDPFAKETASVGVGGITLAGGHAKSYYISVGNGVAKIASKKDYKKSFGSLWQGCSAMAQQDSDKSWSDLVKHIIAYTECE